jgi:hypothetical protein
MMNAVAERGASRIRLDADVIIVGAGFGGLGMAIQLKKAGNESVIVLERANELGGTWRDNNYPGCACDIPALLYSFSFEKYVGWTRIYPQQAEILDYLKRAAHKQRVHEHIRFKSELAEARFDEPTGTWAVTLTDGTILRRRVVVAAMGVTREFGLYSTLRVCPSAHGSAPFPPICSAARRNRRSGGCDPFRVIAVRLGPAIRMFWVYPAIGQLRI